MSDVARLEFAWLQAYHAADADAFDTAALEGLAPDALAQLRLTLHSSVHLLLSSYPIERIWRTNTETQTDVTVSLEEGPDHILITRPKLKVEVRKISGALFAFLSALGNQATLTDALDAALQQDPSFDLYDHLPKLISSRVIAGIDDNGKGVSDD